MIFKRIDSREQTERRFQGALHVAMGLLGWLLPDTSAVIKATSLEDEHIHGELPAELRDPLDVLDRDRLNVALGQESSSDGSEVMVERPSSTRLAKKVINTE